MEAVKEQGIKENQQKSQLIVFRLGDEEYGLQIGQIKEVVPTPHITRLPQTPAYVKGVANIRGNIIAVVDLEEKFGLKQEEDDSANNYTLVVESDEVKMGVLVRELPNTLNVKQSQIEDSANIIQDGGADQSYIKGIVKLDDRLIIMLDIFKTMSESELNGVFKNNKVTENV
ncbi:purine-binding chemotaxis protein CheW [Marivirga sericea]|uniref:Purine-binding chemotaxis protein CheW n=1 Tax=Marivirga sericea TaxID=1028 RepID=A0A1X7KG15_9BACT|nr:chemotaxis protein CheW [Marivirga sericea]SMG39437.1 purine-binding chemotaxis protein CheW [Marivirga sericea]